MRSVLSTLAETFWLIVLAVIVLFAFFLLLGTFSVGQVGWLAAAVGILLVLWCAHAVRMRRRRVVRDPALMHARERRGF